MEGWKTLVFNGAIGLLVIVKELVTYTSGFDWSAILPHQTAEMVILGLGIANILLRHVTVGSAGWRKSAKP